MFDGGQGFGDGGGTVAGDVVCVELAGDGDVAVAVEALDEFLALVAEVRLGGEVGRCRRSGVASGQTSRCCCCYCGSCGLGPVELGIGCLLHDVVSGRASLADLGGLAGPPRVDGPINLVTIIVDVEMLLGRCARARNLPDRLAARGVGDVAAETGLEGVAAAVGQERRHSCGAQAGRGRVVEGVVAVVVLGVCVDALSLCLAPADTPCAVSAGRCDGYNAVDVVFAKVGPFEDQHASHGAANNCGHLLDAQVVEQKFMKTVHNVSLS